MSVRGENKKVQKAKRILSVILSLVMIACTFVVTVSAEGKTAYINGDGVRLRSESNTSSAILVTLYSNDVVTVNSTVTGQEVDGNSTWYNVTYNGQTGFVHGPYVTFPPSSDDYVYDEDFEKNLENFPESYRDALRALHSKYPNWQFVAHKIDLDFNQAVDLQYNPSSTDYKSNKKLVELTYGGNEWRDSRAYDKSVDKYITKYFPDDRIYDGRWTYASRAAIAYFVDPRNYLDEKSIFAFLQQAYNSDLQNKNGLRTVVAGTFLEKGYDKNGDGAIDADAYIDDIMQAAEKSDVSPYVLAAAIIVEVGVNGGTVTSGTYDGYGGVYKGYYNFYNWNATGDDEIKNALQFAKDNGWNSPNTAIVGGAERYAELYVEKGQNTYYYKNYNYVLEPYSSHQFAESIYASITDSKRISVVFTSNTSGAVTFQIPIFTNMGDTASPKPTIAETPQPTPTPPPEPVIKKGDPNDDGVVDVVDLAIVKMHILEMNKLEKDSKNFKASDVNGDGEVDVVDLAAIKMDILEIRKIG